jgi:hypothetical protein
VRAFRLARGIARLAGAKWHCKPLKRSTPRKIGF